MSIKNNSGIALGIIFYLTVLSVSPVMAGSATVSDVSRELVCQCGCTMILSNCSHAECVPRDTMTTLIGQKLAQGEPPDEIIQYFVARYGEQVLASPPKQGFNLTAWLLPLAALLAGAGVIYAALKQWLWRGHSSPTAPMSPETNQEYQERLDKELTDFNESAFR
ncbi:MAG: cytochrome c-type biogenesis protein CcmH [Chloroflexi bacterium]|nr:cytochrome c-type biogenesis protein CcmH [Chloroflexota bacterium]